MARLTILASTEMKIQICCRKKSDCKSFQGQTATEPLTHKQEPLGKAQEAWRCSKQRSRGNDAEKVTRVSNGNRKMLVSKAKVMDSFHKRSLSHSLLSCSKDSLHIWPEENVKDMNIFKKSALSHLQWYCPSLLIVTNCLGCELSESRALLSVFIIPDSSFQCFVLVGT